VLTRQEKERLVIELYNQGKTIRDIAKELRMSFRDIGTIIKKVSGEREEKQDKEQSSLLSPSTQAYRLFSKGKTAIETAIALDLSESETTKYYEEYLNLKWMDELRMIYEEIGGDIVHFLKLFRLSKKERISPEHIVSILRIANNDLAALERKYHRLKKDIVLLELEKQKSEQIGSQVRILAKLSEDYKQQIDELHRRKIALESLIREFENNEAYKKIRRTAEEEVNNALLKGKDLLTLAVSSVIEGVIQDPAKFNFLINSSQHSNGRYKTSQSYIDVYRALILNEAEKIFEIMTRDLTNKIIESAIAKVPLQPSVESSSRQNL
jgi:transposase